MRKLYALLGALLMCAVVGCGEDTNEKIIADTVSILDGTRSDIEQITKTIGDAVSQAKKDGKPLDLTKIEKATQETAAFKKKAEALQRYKAETDVIKDVVTPQQREEFAKKYKSQFQEKLQRLDEAQKSLEAALRDAETVAASNAESKDAVGKLRDALKEAQNEFEVLTKRQS
jgi:hypothetical protein